MNENITLKKAMRLKRKDGTEFRIIHLEGDIVTICELNVSVLYVSQVTAKELISGIINREIEEVEENRPVFDLNSLNEHQKKVYLENKKIADKIIHAYGPTFLNLFSRSKGMRLSDTIGEMPMAKSVLRKLIIRYVQSGLDNHALLDLRSHRKSIDTLSGKKRGRKVSKGRVKYKRLTEDDIKSFEWAKKHYLNSEVRSLKKAFDDMNIKFYREETTVNGLCTSQAMPPEKKPSKRQFYYWMKCNITAEEKKRAKNGQRTYQNDMRPFTGSSMTGVMGPGDMVEADAHELDVDIVSKQYPEICVERPIMYLFIDVYTRMILGVSVALDNNSVVGLTNCFFNLVEDKEALLDKYGISFTGLQDGMTINDIWPSNIRPSTLRVDRGSDFVSNEFYRIAHELQIQIDTVPGGTGSMKGIVERCFRNIEESMNDLLEHKGLIRKVYGSDHKKKACIDIDDAMRIIINYVIMHNTYYMEKYPKSPDMIKRRIKPIPCYLWKYGCEYLSNPLALPERDEYLYTLLPAPKKSTVSRRGIYVNHNYYYNPGDEYLRGRQVKAGESSEDFPVKYDPRDMGHVYYMAPDKKLMTATLDAANINLRPLFEMSYKQYMDLRKEEAMMDAEGDEMNDVNRAANRIANKAIIDDAAKRNPGNKQTTNTRAYREAEKNRVQTEQSVAAKFGMNEEAYGIETVEEVPVKRLPEALQINPNDPEDVNEKKYNEMISRLVAKGTTL